MKLTLWLCIYLLPIFILAILIIKTGSYKIRKQRQTWVYLNEMYYVSLFFTMLITKIQNGYFWLWNGNIPFDAILDRFFISFAIYQIFVIVKRKLDSSAEIDSYQAMKYFCERLLYFYEVNSLVNIENDILFFERNLEKSGDKTMYNQDSLDVFQRIKEFDHSSPEFKNFLSLCIIDFDHYIQTESFHWSESFLLNLFK